MVGIHSLTVDLQRMTVRQVLHIHIVVQERCQAILSEGPLSVSCLVAVARVSSCSLIVVLREIQKRIVRGPDQHRMSYVWYAYAGSGSKQIQSESNSIQYMILHGPWPDSATGNHATLVEGRADPCSPTREWEYVAQSGDEEEGWSGTTDKAKL